MTVAEFSQPDSTVQAPPAWAADVDADFAVHHRLSGPYACHAQATPDMTVRLDAGFVFNPVTRAMAEVAAQDSGTLTAPITDPRIDRVVIDAASGAVGVVTGTEDASPTAPAVPAGKVPVAQIAMTVGMTEIADTIITDERALWALGLAFGTAANDIVTLDGSARLPAVDGSQLTNVTDAGLSSDLRLAFLKLAELDGDRLNMVAGIADPYADESDVDTGASSGQTYDAAGDYYHNPGSQTLISQATGTAIGNMTTYGGLGAAFDGVTSQIQTSCSHLDASSGYVGKDWGDGVSTTVTGVKTWAGSDSGYAGGGTVACDGKLYGSNAAPTGPTDGTLLGTIFAGTAANNSDARELMSGLPATAYRYHWVALISSGGSVVDMAEVQFYETPDPPDMTLVSAAFTAATAPDTARVHVQVTEVDAVTINADLMVDVSRDGGTTWTTATLALMETLADGTVAYEDAAIDISAQPAGTSMKYRVRTDNAKEIRLHGTVLQWA